MNKHSASSRLSIRFVAGLILALTLVCGSSARAADGDNFDDNVKDAAKWGTDSRFGSGVLTERNGRIEYTSASPGPDSDALRPWKLHRFPYNADWEIQMDVVNTSTAALINQVNSFGFKIFSPHSADDYLYVELYGSSFGGLPFRYGFESAMETGGSNTGFANGNDSATNAAVRMTFDSMTKEVFVFYDVNRQDGYQWVPFGSFGVAGMGGTNGTTDWHLAADEQFTAYVYGYSSLMVVPTGRLFGDNFQESGGVTPSSAAAPVPTGSFGFQFPTNNPLLTRILSVSGNYTGTGPVSNRVYNIDVAQDESGKLAAMGTVEGILDKNGSPDLSASVGTIKTVNDEPTVQLKTTFKGTIDGAATTLSGSATAPLTAMDIGGGTNGIDGTLTVKGRVGTNVVAVRNAAVQFPIPASASNNVRQEWSLQLDISSRTIKNKDKIVASAQLQLPNGDTISYPEKIVRYSATKGYTLAFTRGTNVTVLPPRITNKSTITIKGLTFVKSGSDWEPTGGVITYKFLGQKGTENLLDFLAP